MHCFCNQLSMLWFHSAAHAAHFLWACVRAEEYLRNCNETITWELLATRRLLRTVFLLSMSTEEPNSFQIIILIILLLPFGMSKSIVMINTTIIDSYNICVTCWKRLTVWSLKTLLTSDVLSAITTFREEHFIRVWRSVFRSVWSDSECVFLYLSLAPNLNSDWSTSSEYCVPTYYPTDLVVILYKYNICNFIDLYFRPYVASAYVYLTYRYVPKHSTTHRVNGLQDDLGVKELPYIFYLRNCRKYVEMENPTAA